MFNSYVCLPEGNWSSETIIVLHCIESVLSCGCVVSYLILCGIVGTVGVWQKTWVTVRRLVVLSTKHSKFRVTHTIHSGKRDEDIYGASYRD